MINEVQIILVEDNPDDALLSIRAFQKSHIANSVIHLKNGEEAVDFVIKGEVVNGNKVSDGSKIILLDLNMPKVNGIDFLKQFNEAGLQGSIPVIVLTSSDDDPSIKTCYELGVNSYIMKPVEFQSFANAVIRLGLNWTIIYRKAG